MRFISMKHFRSPDAVKRCVFNRETIVLGQIVGEVNGSLRKTNRLQDGSETVSDVLLGDFAGVCYETRAKMEATGKNPDEAEMGAEALYMPKWFAEAVVAKLAANRRIEFAVEVIIMPTPEGQAIQYQYDVKSLIARPANSPVERMKRTLQQNGILKLAAPVEVSTAALPDFRTETPHDPETGVIEEAGEGGEQFPEPGPDDTDVAADVPVDTATHAKRHKK